MTRVFVVALAAIGLAAGAMAALPEADPGPQGPRPDLAVLQREAGLTEAQVAQVRQLRQDERKLAIRRRADMQIARMELDERLDAATVDEKAVAAKVKVLADLQAAELKARVDHRLALRKVVTAEQLEKMRMLRRQHRFDRPREGRGPGHGPRGRRPEGPQPRPDGPGPDGEGDDEAR